ncbi:hypothetical protein F5Y16DRAFT_409969 [Xylariaceae sp. FL0255]|nr:hypothetical protein F5Y16DRAFT_409969 [Xylariaceae sp. FL0255]
MSGQSIYPATSPPTPMWPGFGTCSDETEINSHIPSRKSLLSRHFALSSRQTAVSSEASTKVLANAKGPFGITTVHRPISTINPIAQVIFIHGLGGGSEHTWTKDGVHWPRDLLPQQSPLQQAGIHVFGYDSDFKKSSTLNIYDFSKSLLNSILNNPDIRASQCPIIMIGHTRQTAIYESICLRLKAMIFIATPHTGSGLPYLEDLTRNSVTVQSTKPLSLGGVRDVMVVPKADAVLNYPHEQSALLYGDHRSVCKFNSAEDHNFIVLWQAIVAWDPEIEPTATEIDDDLDRLLGLPGTCNWLTEDTKYHSWIAIDRATSFAAGHVIEKFEKSPHYCCYYFFNHGDRGKSSLEGFLISMAWQMANIYSDDNDLAKSGDFRILNRKFWEQGVLQASLDHPCFWLNGNVKILVTSRNSRDIEIPDTQEDIAKFLDAHKHSIPGSTSHERDTLRQLILEKSNGCFLWANLVLKRLPKIIGSQARFRALEEMPPGMDHLYARILTSMSQKENTMSRTVLMWLQFVLENVVMDELDDIDSMNSRVKMRHASARRFLLRHDINSDLPDDFTISEEEAHKKLALACLDYLNGPEMKTKAKRKMVASTPTKSVFIDYASSALDSEVLSSLATFLKTNILDLETILRFARVLKVFLRRKSKVDLLLGDDVFGRQLLMHPESILQLIPPFCPVESAPYSQFARGNHASLSVVGLLASSWDDCLCTIVLNEPVTASSRSVAKERLHSLTSSGMYFGIGTSKGRVAIFNERTCQEEKSLEHGSPVLQMRFAESKPLLASASKRVLRLWNTETWEQHWEIRFKSPCLAMAFVDDDKLLLLALANNTLLALNLLDRVESITTWTDILDDPHRDWYHGTSPQFASFNPDLGLLAIGYSCRHVLIYNYDMESYEVFHHREGLCDYVEELSNISLYAMAFSRLPDTSLLAVSYSTAELVLFDVQNGTVQATITSAFFSRLESSSDGKHEGAVSALTFTADSNRFLVIRAGGHNCRVWDPAALYRRDVGHESVRSPSLGSGSQDGVYDQPDNESMMVSSVEFDAQGEVIFVGKEDHSVSIHDAKTGTSLGVLFSHVGSVKSLSFINKGPKSILISADSAGFLILHHLKKSGKTWSAEQLHKHRGSVTGIQQFLCDKGAKLLLVYSNPKSTILELTTGEIIATCIIESSQGRPGYWLQHPTDDSSLLFADGYLVYQYDWSTLERLGGSHNGIKLKVDLTEELVVAAATSLFSQSLAVLAMTFKAVRKTRQTAVKCFTVQSFDLGSSAADAINEYEATCEKIQLLIGMFRDRVVFLHTDGWVCSVKASGMRGEGEGIMHHFAPPREWLQSNRDLSKTVWLS